LRLYHEASAIPADKKGRNSSIISFAGKI